MQKLFTAVLVALMALAGGALAQTFTLMHSFQSPAPGNFNQFGTAVAAVGNNVLVGEPSNPSGGSAYLFDGNTGALLLTFPNPTPVSGELFGRAVAGVGNNVLIGAPGASGGVGKAYLFNGTTGALLLTFTIPSPTIADQFGFAVAGVGNNVLIGAPGHDTGSTDAGEAYLFDGTTGTLLLSFLNPTPTPSTGVPDQFGKAVAGVGNDVLIGALGDDTGATNAGAAYLFNGATGVLLQTFTNPTPFLSDQFGAAVAGAGNNALVGAPFDDTGATNAGSAYLFDGVSGSLLQTISNPSPNSGDNFGWSVAAFGINVLVLIGTPNGDAFAGKAYLYDGTFTSPVQTFSNPTPVAGDQFGFAVAASGNNVIIGALGDDTAGEDAGAAYLYSSNPPLVANAGNDAAICIGASANLNGTASGGDGSYSFTWAVQSGPNTSSAQFNNPTLEDPVFTPTLAGTYVLRFTVDDGVVTPVFDDVQIAVNALPVANAGPDQTVSSGQTVQIGGSPTGSGGTPPFTYSWAPTTGLDDPSAANPNATATTTTIYTVTVTDANNCTATDQVQVTVTTANLALNKPATASKTQNGYSADNAVDGSLSTEWRSGNVKSSAMVWWRVDLGATYNINNVVIFWQSSFYATQYHIQVSLDGNGWTTVYTDNAGNGGTDNVTFAAADARYVLINMTQHNDKSERINEVEVYGILAKATAENTAVSAAAIPQEISLAQNYPNPFSANGTFGNPDTEIRFALPEASHATVKIFNMLGENIRTLADADFSTGVHVVRWNAQNDRGEKAPSGIYFYQLVTPGFTQTRRMILAK